MRSFSCNLENKETHILTHIELTSFTLSLEKLIHWIVLKGLGIIAKGTCVLGYMYSKGFITNTPL